MKYTLVPIITMLIAFASSCNDTKSNTTVSESIIQVEYPETYELANIILALTEYGQTDPWEVRQGFAYYSEVQAYFKPVSNHPLLDSVNYSRERWEAYLSFRTDAYAFSFDENNQLKRDSDFYTNEGFSPFDKHLELINDFVAKSNFRSFFAAHQDYYKSIAAKYKETQYLNEMRTFLASEFEPQFTYDDQYKVVLSPFVYRMNCHREIDSTTTADFITIPAYVLSDTITVKDKDIATGVHNLFTEMDHGYVNPTTKKLNELVSNNFDETVWTKESGYENSDNAVFNEYMTWAVYDLFLQKHFPEFAEEVGLYWSFQNESRGFPYAQLFTQKLLRLYNSKKTGETIEDLYPQLLQWTSEIQKRVTKPTLLLAKDSISLSFSPTTEIRIAFSEPMKKAENFTIILQDEKQQQTIHEITAQDNGIAWVENGEEVTFTLALPATSKHYYILFNWWGTKNPIYSEKNILLTNTSYLKLINK